MNFQEHEASRVSILTALRELGGFVQNDADFRGSKTYQTKAIGYQRQFLEDGKYRVVFLGAFNVGKSTAINAFLGGAYLPMDVEECTSKLTFIQRGEQLQLLLRLKEAASPSEIDALGRLYATIPAGITATDDAHEVRVTYGADHPGAMCRSLEPLVAVLADEEFPHLAPLREKIEELSLCLPSTVLEEDIVIVDTPGVHSVSETRQEITYGIIEHSHLVVCLVDSAMAGNVHDLNFIQRIIKLRGRRVFFILNKADKLESDEIDMRGGRGPAASLLEAFKRHDIPEDCEVFFLSSYRALRAQQMDQGHVTLEEVLDDNRVSIPTSVVQRITPSEDAASELSAYLMGQSRLPHVKERLLDYLLNENKAGAVIETAARFIWERADDFATTLENEIKVARDPALFDELRANREKLMARLEEIRQSSEKVLEEYGTRSRGGAIEMDRFAGYEATFREAMNDLAVDTEVIQPIVAWLREDNNLKEARRSKYRTLTAQIEHQVDEFVSGIMAQLARQIDEVEGIAREGIAEQLGQVRELRVNMTEPGRLEIALRDGSMAGSYAAFGAGGAVLGVAAGAAVGTSVMPVIGTAIGAGLGVVVGAVAGVLARLAWSEDRWIKKLQPIIEENVGNMLIKGGVDQEGSRAAPVLDSVVDYLQRRIVAFEQAVREEVDNAIGTVQREVDDLLEREDEIRQERETIINRLEPKVAMLDGLRTTAVATMEELRERAPMAS